MVMGWAFSICASRPAPVGAMRDGLIAIRAEVNRDVCWAGAKAHPSAIDPQSGGASAWTTAVRVGAVVMFTRPPRQDGTL